MSELPKVYPFAIVLRRAFKQDIAEVGDDPQRLGEMLCGSAMICFLELQNRYGAETALTALSELRLYVDKLERVVTAEGPRTSH